MVLIIQYLNALQNAKDVILHPDQIVMNVDLVIHFMVINAN